MDRRELNRIINQLDPPKDLAVTTSWTQAQKLLIERMITEMFGPITNPAWKPLGNHTGVISDELHKSESTKKMYDNPVKIVRLKYVTGHSATPKNLFLVQDNGPIDIIDKPIILITGGAVIDAAGKTKTPSTNGTYTIKNLIKEGIYNTLPASRFIEQLAMEGILSGDVGMAYDTAKDQYTITIPTTLGPIIETFNANFQPISGKPTPSYFAGNPQKNVAIQKALDKSPADLVTAKKYVLSKEVSDTFQVVWTDMILNEQSRLSASASPSSSSSAAPAFVRANTVVGTTDNVVKYRCIAYNVGCIHTDTLGVSRHFIPQGSSPAEQELIRRQQIEMIGNELMSHNESVITLLEEVENSTNKDNEWVEQVSWSRDVRGKAKTYLKKKLAELVSFNEDLRGKVALLRESATEADLATVKALKNSERLRSPFVRYKNGDYYKKMATVRSLLLDGRIPFAVNRFTTTANFNSMAGGARVQTGGENTDRLKRILQKNIKGDFKTTLMFLCFINEYMPELITYAKCMNTAMNMIDPQRLAKDTVPKQTARVLRNPVIPYKLLEQDIKYLWDEEDTFVLLDDVDSLFTAEEYKEINNAILHVIVYSNLFTDLFQDTYDDKHSTLNYKFREYLVNPDSLRDDGMDLVSSIAITLYENEFRMEMLSTHGDLSPQATADEINKIIFEINVCRRESDSEVLYLVYTHYFNLFQDILSTLVAVQPAAGTSPSFGFSSLRLASSPGLEYANLEGSTSPFVAIQPAAAVNTIPRSKSSRGRNNGNNTEIVRPESKRPVSTKRELVASFAASSSNNNSRSSQRTSPIFAKAALNEYQQAAKPKGNSQPQPQTLSQGYPQGFASQVVSNMDGGKRRTHKKRKQKKRTTRRH